MKLEKATNEHLIYLLAVLLAASLRFIGLGNLPLSDMESTWANQAFHIVKGGGLPIVGDQPGYILLTSVVFFLFGSSEFLARFWPAVSGTLLVMVPLLYRERMGRTAAMILAVGLAIEPSLVAASRQADGRILAIAGFAFAVGFLLKRNAAGTGIFAGLAIFGGPTAWNILLVLGLGLGGKKLTGGKNIERDLTLRPALGWIAGATLFFGMLFGFLPGGLSALFDSLVSCLKGWTAIGAVEPSLLLTTWVILSPLVFVLGLFGVIRGIFIKETIDRSLIGIWGSLFVVCLAYPGRQTADLAYSAVPFLVIGALQADYMLRQFEWKMPALGYTALIAVLGISLWMNFSSFTNPAIRVEDNPLRWGGIIGVVSLMAASFILIGWGWAWNVARNGFLSGLGSVLLVYTLAAAWSSAGLNVRPEMELWVNGNYPSEQKLALKVLGDVSEWQTGHKDTLDLVVTELDTPSLRWALRNYRNVSFVSQLAPDSKPSVVISVLKPGANLGLGVAYTGQPLVWGQSVNWPALLSQDWIPWFFYRDLPYRPDIINRQSIILWLRSDLFPASAKTARPSP
jgi:hypothetical protein